VAAISLYTLNTPQADVENHSFDLWKLKFNKKYSSKEEAYRMGVWMENFAYVQAHNARFEAGKETFDLEMNEFADMNTEEFGAKYLIKMPETSVTTSCTGAQASTDNLPEEVDW